MNPLLEQVTLIVYGWRHVQPGPIQWVFPSLATALGAVHVMQRNVTDWAILSGPSHAPGGVDVDAARALGRVLAEAQTTACPPQPARADLF